MPKHFLNVNSQKFLGTHFHIANELERFLEDSTKTKNTAHHYITVITPLMYAIISMNENFLKFTLNESLINFLKQINKYFSEMLLELNSVYPQCNETNFNDNFTDLINESQKTYKKTVAELRKAPATNMIEKTHLKNLTIVLISVREITILNMKEKDCLRLFTLLCDLDLTIKTYLTKLNKLIA